MIAEKKKKREEEVCLEEERSHCVQKDEVC